jgi:hypothetical protein
MWSRSAANRLLVQRIEQVLQPSGQQKDAFEALKKALQDRADNLHVSCPSEMPQGPYAQLDAAKTRLTAMVEAMNAIRPKLQDFYVLRVEKMILTEEEERLLKQLKAEPKDVAR